MKFAAVTCKVCGNTFQPWDADRVSVHKKGALCRARLNKKLLQVDEINRRSGHNPRECFNPYR